MGLVRVPSPAGIYHDCLHLLIHIEKVLVILRDGRKLLGVFRSYDQYGLLPLAPRGDGRADDDS